MENKTDQPLRAREGPRLPDPAGTKQVSDPLGHGGGPALSSRGVGRPMGFQKALGQGSLALQPGLGCGMLGTMFGTSLGKS